MYNQWESIKADPAVHEANKAQRRARYHNTYKAKLDKPKLKEYTHEWYLENKERLLNLNLEFRKRNPRRVLLSGIKSRCKKGNIPFNLTLDDIIVPEVCPVLGIPLVWHAGTGVKKDNGNNHDSPSVDRVDPSKGYVKGNIRIISKRANLIKNDATVKELELILEYYKKAMGEINND